MIHELTEDFTSGESGCGDEVDVADGTSPLDRGKTGIVWKSVGHFSRTVVAVKVPRLR